MKKITRWLVGFASLALFVSATPLTQAASQKKAAGKDPYGIEKILKKLMQKKKVSPNKNVQLDIILKPQNENQITDKIYAVNTLVIQSSSSSILQKNFGMNLVSLRVFLVV